MVILIIGAGDPLIRRLNKILCFKGPVYWSSSKMLLNSISYQRCKYIDPFQKIIILCFLKLRMNCARLWIAFFPCWTWLPSKSTRRLKGFRIRKNKVRKIIFKPIPKFPAKSTSATKLTNISSQPCAQPYIKRLWFRIFSIWHKFAPANLPFTLPSLFCRTYWAKWSRWCSSKLRTHKLPYVCNTITVYRSK